MSTGIVASLGSLKSVKEERSGKSGSPATQTASPRAPLPLQGTSKKLHPDFSQMTTYVRKATKKAAWRRFEDEGGVEISDLVEILLDRYAAGQLGNVLRG
jgi:hypothetical protein